MEQEKANHGAILRQLWKKSKMSLEEIAQLSGYSRSSLYRWMEFPEVEARILYNVSVVVGIDISDQVEEVAQLREEIMRGEQLAKEEELRRQPKQQMIENFKDRYMMLLEKYSNLQSELREQQAEYYSLQQRIHTLENRDNIGTPPPENPEERES
jgi:transcriptional regulator with XRE-family HTH domain